MCLIINFLFSKFNDIGRFGLCVLLVVVILIGMNSGLFLIFRVLFVFLSVWLIVMLFVKLIDDIVFIKFLIIILLLNFLIFFKIVGFKIKLWWKNWL